MSVRRGTTFAALTALVVLSAACTSTSSSGGVSNTVAVGELPTDVATTTTEPVPTTQLGRSVTGNRVILIGDSVMASTAERHGGAMCDALVPLGWAVDVEAETGQFAAWGNKVLDAMAGQKFDVAVVLLGNNYLGDQDVYRREMERIVDRLAPALIVLSTVSEFQPDRREVNDVIADIAAANPEITVLDWAAATAADRTLTGPDRLHLGTKGKAALAAAVADILGEAPSTEGRCLKSTFVDDSNGSVTGTTTTTSQASTSTVTTDTNAPDTTGV